MRREPPATLFHKARGVEYQAVCRDILRHLDRYQANHRRSSAQLRGKLDGLKRELDRIQSIDYLKAPAGERARTLWETTASRAGIMAPGKRATEVFGMVTAEVTSLKAQPDSVPLQQATVV